MSTRLHTPEEQSDAVTTRAEADCDGKTCRTGICSPCLVIWGLVALWLIIKALLETFQ